MLAAASFLGDGMGSKLLRNLLLSKTCPVDPKDFGKILQQTCSVGTKHGHQSSRSSGGETWKVEKLLLGLKQQLGEGIIKSQS